MSFLIPKRGDEHDGYAEGKQRREARCDDQGHIMPRLQSVRPGQVS